MTSSNNKRTSHTPKRTVSSKSTSKSTGKKKSTGRTGASTTNKKASNSASKRKIAVQEEEYGFDYVKTLILIGVFAVFILMFLFSIGIFEGKMGQAVEGFIKGLFGFNSYIIPVVGIGLLFFVIFAKHTKKMIVNIICSVAFVISVGLFDHYIVFEQMNKMSYKEVLSLLYKTPMGSGVFIGSFAYLLELCFGKALILILAILLFIASIWVICGKYLLSLAELVYEKFQNLDSGYEDEDEDDNDSVKKHSRIKETPEDTKAKKKTPSFKIMDDEKPEDKISLKSDVIDVDPFEIKSIKEVEPEVVKKETNDVHQIKVKDIKNDITVDEITPINIIDVPEIKNTDSSLALASFVPVESTPQEEITVINPSNNLLPEDTDKSTEEVAQVPKTDSEPIKFKNENKGYVFPPVNLLQENKGKQSGNKEDIKETAQKLKETLKTFNVDVEIDEANCVIGPAVTRYELTPAPGVKVSRIVSLSDDIKLSLSAADIRIEAPIPGKSAVGIEVPNSVSSSVGFRDLIDSNDFRNSKSKITFAVGKDLAGQIVLADIAKMPHLLIAGATGSGKSVCINSIIMSILYKARPDEVKMILIDPKVVELSIYNGIPHLLLPVVTDPKKASASLHWGVSEMEKRYKLFAEAEVRDIKGYNDKCHTSSKDDNMQPLPQIVIIVDELADLMMVAGKEVEESICRLAQLARAAGIHIIIATQRPSVDVITGLIKANMPSRIAFSVSSGVDSRTILDANGAEKLLGKGDMLYFPQGMNKPSRVQGCFVSDEEVSNVVSFIKNTNTGNEISDISSQLSASGNELCEVPGGDVDDLFAQAGSFIIDKEKASIGALQRAFKIGFNRAARIMDQLEAKGVVGPEEGTKPRKILMSVSEFEELINNMK